MRKLLSFIFLHFPFWAAAQSLSIQQLWQQLPNNLGYQQDLLQTQIHREALHELRTQRIPVFYVDGNLQRNLIIPTTPVPAIAFDPDAQQGAVIPLKFATRWSSRAGVQLEWNLFDPSRRSDEREQDLRIKQAENQENQHAQDWKRDATLAYASVVLATQQYELAIADSVAYTEIRQVSKTRYEAGRESLSSYHTAQQAFERTRIQLYEAWSVLVTADLELRKYVDLSSTVSLATDIAGIRDYIQSQKKENYLLRSLELDQELSSLQQYAIKRQLLPSLTINAYWGEQYFSNEFRLANNEEWFGNSFVNLALRVPLSAHFTTRPSLRKATLNYTLHEKQLKQAQRLDSLQHKQLAVKIQNAMQKVDALSRIAQLALETKVAQEASYRAGRLLLSDYNQFNTDYNKAKRDVWQASYELIELLMD